MSGETVETVWSLDSRYIWKLEAKSDTLYPVSGTGSAVFRNVNISCIIAYISNRYGIYKWSSTRTTCMCPWGVCVGDDVLYDVTCRVTWLPPSITCSSDAMRLKPVVIFETDRVALPASSQVTVQFTSNGNFRFAVHRKSITVAEVEDEWRNTNDVTLTMYFRHSSVGTDGPAENRLQPRWNSTAQLLSVGRSEQLVLWRANYQEVEASAGRMLLQLALMAFVERHLVALLPERRFLNTTDSSIRPSNTFSVRRPASRRCVPPRQPASCF